MTVGCQFGENFVHILDDSTLDILLNNRDTIVDFIHYLEQKETALSEHAFVIHGEENLLAEYIANRNSERGHFIPVPESLVPVIIQDDAWNNYVGSESFRLTQEENRISYNIDMLIEHFTKSYAGQRMTVGQDQPLSYHEQALRMMAKESRFGRRTISTMLISILQEEVTTTFWVSTVPSFATSDLRYVFVTYPAPPPEVGLEQCEQYILEYLSKHMLVARHIFPESTCIIGIAIPNRACTMITNFLRILDGRNWTTTDHEDAAKLQRSTGFFVNLEEVQYIHVE